MENRVKAKLRKGEVTFGTWIQSVSPNVVDLLRLQPVDWFAFDMEHSPITIETVSHMVQVLNGSTITPLVRVGQVDQALIKLVLDTGNQGIVAPLINTPEDAEKAVQFCKYPPMGVRGAAGTKPSDYGANLGSYLREANNETIVIAQIETPQALDNVSKIVGVDGVDIAFVGPTDLTLTLGLVDNRGDPKVREAMKRVVAACKDAGKNAGVMAADLNEAKQAVELGFTFISLASDMKYLTMGAKSFLGAVGRI